MWQTYRQKTPNKTVVIKGLQTADPQQVAVEVTYLKRVHPHKVTADVTDIRRVPVGVTGREEATARRH